MRAVRNFNSEHQGGIPHRAGRSHRFQATTRALLVRSHCNLTDKCSMGMAQPRTMRGMAKGHRRTRSDPQIDAGALVLARGHLPRNEERFGFRVGADHDAVVGGLTHVQSSFGDTFSKEVVGAHSDVKGEGARGTGQGAPPATRCPDGRSSGWACTGEAHPAPPRPLPRAGPGLRPG